MQHKTRLFSRVAMMLLMMLLTATTAWAEGVDYIPNGVTLRQANFTEDGDDTYTILNAAGWDAFCDRLAADDGKTFFTGKTVKLGADITVSRMAGSDHHDFCGTFDGQEHTLTFNYNTAKDDAAPFRYVEDGCVIKDLRVCGTIETSAKYAAGLVAHQYGNVTIRNCRSSVTIKSSVSSENGDGTHGGFVAENCKDGDITFEGCLFDGKLLKTGGTGTNRCGGFVGWRSSNDNAKITVTNSLYAPAALEVGEMWVSSTESATFVRNGIASDITNSYYTSDFNDGSSFTGQGKKACPAIAAPVGDATAIYTVSGITPYTNGLKRTVDDVETFYYGGGENVSVSYVDESGTTVSHAAIALDPSNMPTTLSGWYYVADDITYTSKIALDPDVTLILADGKTMNVGTSESPISSGYGINGKSSYSLTIYGQSAQSGTLNAYSSGSSNQAVYVKNYAQHGGIVTIDASNYGALRLSKGNLILTRGSLTANATGTDGSAIDLDNNYGVTVSGGTLNATGNTAINGAASTVPVLTMTGGTVTATGSKNGIIGRVAFSGGNLTANGSTNGTTDGIYSNVTLSWTSADDRIYASSYGSKVTITDGQAFTTDGTDIYMGKLSSGEKAAIAGKTLRPKEILDLSDNSDNTSVISANNNSTIAIQLSGRTLYQDGDWNTLCLPFALSAEQIAASPLSGATIMELDGAGSHLTDGTLTLNFNAATEIEAGRPYIVKWPITRVINTPSDWHDFAADVAGGNTYEGKIVRLAADIKVSEMVGPEQHKFKGVFDGQGHTLTLSSPSTSGLACAPFLYVEGATIANLHTTGTVIAVNNKFRSGLVAQSDGTTTIHNCWSSVTISSSISGDGNHGGFIGMSNSGNATISNCLFDGSFSGRNTKCWGGFVGSSYSTTTIRNSVFAPAKILINHDGSATFSPNNVTTTNCYYSEALNDENNGATAIGTTSADDLAADLGSGWQVKDGKAVPVTATPGITNPVFSGTVPSGYTSAEAIATALVEASSKSTYVDFIGTYNPIVWETENRNVLFLGGNNTLYFPQPDGDKIPHLGAFRGYFQLNGITASDITEARMNFDEQGTQTGIGHTEITERADAWYSLDGRKLDGKPTSKGLYIHGNKKVVVE